MSYKIKFDEYLHAEKRIKIIIFDEAINDSIYYQFDVKKNILDVCAGITEMMNSFDLKFDSDRLREAIDVISKTINSALRQREMKERIKTFEELKKNELNI
jgi:hypothetical protein